MLPEDICGHYLKIFQSFILSEDQVSRLINLCQFHPNQEWNLIYRATQDGFGASQFHEKCDNKPKTLVIIKSTKGYVFGGYTEKDWSPCYNDYKYDSNAFIFSLTNSGFSSLKIKCVQPDYAIATRKDLGPTFGKFDYDLTISYKSNHEQYNYSNLGGSYKHPNANYDLGSFSAKSFLAGEKYFHVSEIEVFIKI